MLLNIELKGPLDPDWGAYYDYNMAATKVIELINKYDIALKVMVSSFVPKILESIILMSDSSRKFII